MGPKMSYMGHKLTYMGPKLTYVGLGSKMTYVDLN